MGSYGYDALGFRRSLFSLIYAFCAFCAARSPEIGGLSLLASGAADGPAAWFRESLLPLP